MAARGALWGTVGVPHTTGEWVIPEIPVSHPISHAQQRSGANAYNVSFSYDGDGNRTLKNDSGQLSSYVYNTGDQLLALTTPDSKVTTSAWDGEGNLASENAAGSLTTYTWDEENRLTEILSPDASLVTHTYGADGLRRKKESSSTTRNFVWDGVNMLQELDNLLATQAQYTDYPGSWGGLVSMRRSGASSFYGFDLQANARLLASPAGADHRQLTPSRRSARWWRHPARQ